MERDETSGNAGNEEQQQQQQQHQQVLYPVLREPPSFSLSHVEDEEQGEEGPHNPDHHSSNDFIDVYYQHVSESIRKQPSFISGARFLRGLDPALPNSRGGHGGGAGHHHHASNLHSSTSSTSTSSSQLFGSRFAHSRCPALYPIPESDLVFFPLREFNLYLDDSGLSSSQHTQFCHYLRVQWHDSPANGNRLPDNICDMGKGQLEEFRRLMRDRSISPAGIKFLETERKRVMNKQAQDRCRIKYNAKGSHGGREHLQDDEASIPSPPSNEPTPMKDTVTSSTTTNNPDPGNFPTVLPAENNKNPNNDSSCSRSRNGTKDNHRHWHLTDSAERGRSNSAPQQNPGFPSTSTTNLGPKVALRKGVSRHRPNSFPLLEANKGLRGLQQANDYQSPLPPDESETPAPIASVEMDFRSPRSSGGQDSTPRGSPRSSPYPLMGDSSKSNLSSSQIKSRKQSLPLPYPSRLCEDVAPMANSSRRGSEASVASIESHKTDQPPQVPELSDLPSSVSTPLVMLKQESASSFQQRHHASRVEHHQQVPYPFLIDPGSYLTAQGFPLGFGNLPPVPGLGPAHPFHHFAPSMQPIPVPMNSPFVVSGFHPMHPSPSFAGLSPLAYPPNARYPPSMYPFAGMPLPIQPNSQPPHPLLIAGPNQFPQTSMHGMPGQFLAPVGYNGSYTLKTTSDSVGHMQIDSKNKQSQRFQ